MPVALKYPAGALDAIDVPYIHHQLEPCCFDGYRSSREAKDSALMRLMLEAPRLPAAAVPSFLATTLALGPDWATAALSTANNLVLLRPPDRSGLCASRAPTCSSRHPGHSN